MQIRCVSQNHRACSGVPETVIITDMNYYPVSRYHFDLSGTAFGAMAKDGRNDELRHAGIIDMQFKRSPSSPPPFAPTTSPRHTYKSRFCRFCTKAKPAKQIHFCIFVTVSYLSKKLFVFRKHQIEIGNQHLSMALYFCSWLLVTYESEPRSCRRLRH